MNKKRSFIFDTVIDSDSGQDVVYQAIAGDLIKSFFDGYNATIMAYG